MSTEPMIADYVRAIESGELTDDHFARLPQHVRDAVELAMNPPTCLDAHSARERCAGATEYRESLSGTGTPIPRCDAHWSARLREQDRINRTYPQHAPSDFDPSYAGESWDED
jgi:hypothetical protein